MNYAFTNGKILDGSRDMQVQTGRCILVKNGKIHDIVSDTTDLSGYTKVDLKGHYILPGLINMHVHLAGSGKPQKKQRDNEKLVNTIMSSSLTRAIAYRMVSGFAKDELLSGVTTIRTVGGLGDFDTRLRDEIKAGTKVGPRILAANQGISVPGGHMAGSVAVAASSIPDARSHLKKSEQQKVDLIKLMITGGVLDAKEKGVDSIEHGAKLTDEMITLFKERGAFLCTTISPALPYALFDRSITTATKRSAELTDIDSITGSIEKGKAADLIVTAQNPLKDLKALRNLEMVISGGRFIEHPKIKKRKQVEAELDKFL